VTRGYTSADVALALSTARYTLQARAASTPCADCLFASQGAATFYLALHLSPPWKLADAIPRRRCNVWQPVAGERRPHQRWRALGARYLHRGLPHSVRYQCTGTATAGTQSVHGD